MKKKLFTVIVDNYFPELLTYTVPNIERFAHKIGAELSIISERKYPEFPPTFEKLQIHELGRDSDYNILVDADTMFHREMFDPTSVVMPNSFGCYMQFDASLLFEPDEFFYRDGRALGVASNFMVVPRACHDIWTPFEFTAEEAKTKTKRWFIIDEYCISRNVARYGLKCTGLLGNDLQHLIQHFDVNSKNPDKQAVVEAARAYAELHTP